MRGLVAVGSLARHTLWALSWPGGIVQQTDAGDVWKSVPLPTGGLPRALVSSYLGDPHVLVGSSLFSILDDDVKAVSRNVPVDAKLIAHAPEQVWFAGSGYFP